MKILWSQSALADLEAIHAYIARDSKVYADAVVFDIFTAIDRLEKFPKSGRVVPEVNDENTRELIVNNYRVVYDLTSAQAIILAILHGAMRFNLSE